jgi:hypothetical protein
MSEQKTKQPNKLTASQKIQALENNIVNLSRQNIELYNEIQYLKEQKIDKMENILNSVIRRFNSAIAVSEKYGKITHDLISQNIIEENVRVLETNVAKMEEMGVLVKAKDGIINDKSFVVVRELKEDNSVINPRLQFAMPTINKEFQDKFIGKKVGEIIESEPLENKEIIKTEILMVYDVHEVEKEVDFKDEEEKVEEKQPETP